MQSWTGRGSRSLFCALESVPRFAERQFTTTPILGRSKKKQTSKPNRDEHESSQSKFKLGPSITKSGRPSAGGAREFPRAVEVAVQEFQDTLYKTGQSLEGWDRFSRQVLNAVKADDSRASKRWKLLKASLQGAYLSSGLPGLKDELGFLLQFENITNKYSIPHLQSQEKVADLRYPAEWYPKARSMQRNIHLHVGPTNSGKTYHALKRLEGCKNGFYAGPLRLLAQEVYHRFHATGVPCSLVTGDEVKAPENGELPRVVSNTVEMVSLGDQYDVGVIDEIQMIANSTRGWAWTRAVLGTQVSELHLCGETRTVPLIRELCALTGDNLEIHRYERLNPLKVMPHSLRGNLSKLERGDCVVAFSRVGIHTLKGDIEKTTGRRAAIVYGGLPAEIRTQQANLFNDPDNDYDFLVASDAIGMGLNL
ncbi:Helicase C-terminal [Penicillium capsulatum]|nr:Helicase C-terminal [Penicillium capsulatum]